MADNQDQTMNVSIVTLTGESYDIQINRNATITQLKSACHARPDMGWPPETQRYIFAGKRLEDGRRMTDYGIGDGCMLHCVFRDRHYRQFPATMRIVDQSIALSFLAIGVGCVAFPELILETVFKSTDFDLQLWSFFGGLFMACGAFLLSSSTWVTYMHLMLALEGLSQTVSYYLTPPGQLNSGPLSILAPDGLNAINATSFACLIALLASLCVESKLTLPDVLEGSTALVLYACGALCFVYPELSLPLVYNGTSRALVLVTQVRLIGGVFCMLSLFLLGMNSMKSFGILFFGSFWLLLTCFADQEQIYSDCAFEFQITVGTMCFCVVGARPLANESQKRLNERFIQSRKARKH